MIYCLIDTCSLINLLSKEDSLKDLENLNFWQEKNALQILLPETVKIEWNKHKIKEKEKYRQTVNTKFKHTREMLTNTSFNIPSGYLEIAYGKIETKINAIDSLLEKANEIPITTTVKALIPDRQLLNNNKRKAPFHNKIDSVKDAYIIFSALEHLKEKQANKLLFISENKNDFGNPKNKNREIHSDISSDYPSIQIDYYSDIFFAINEYKKEMPILEVQQPHAIEEKEEALNQYSNKGRISIDKTEPLLNQLYYYLKIRFEEIKILPSYLFISYYPFENGATCYRSDFALRNINPELLEVLKTFEIIDRKLINNFNSKNDYDKASFILNTLSRNLIFYLHGKKREDFRDIRVHNKQQKLNLIDKYIQFKFIGVYKELDKEHLNNTIDKNLKAGYFYYKIGDLIKSKDCFLKARELALKEKQEVTQLICNHNLHHLARSIEFRYWKLENKSSIIKKLKSIDNRQTKVSAHNLKIKDLIVDNSFFTSAQIKLQTLKEEIIDTYQGYLRGSRSSNNFDWEIFYQYATLHQFLSKNHIVYEHYSDYDDVINSLVESVFASYAIKNGMNKINHLDDYTLLHFVHYAKTKDLEKFYKRYHLSKLNYLKSEDEEEDIVSLFLNFISNNINQLKALLKQQPEQVSDKFWNDYNRYFTNLLFLCSILKFEKEVVKRLSVALIEFLDKNLSWLCHRSNENSKYIYHFFIRQQEYIRPGIIKRVFFLSYKHEEFFSEYLNSELVDSSLELKHKIKITDIQLSNKIIPCIKNRIFEEGRLNQYNIVTHIYPLLNPTQRKIYFNFYLGILKKEYNHYLFYILVVYNVFDINFGDYLNKYLNTIDLKNDVEHRSRGLLQKPTFTRYNKIDSLLNMWFKYDFSLKDPRITKFKGINDYYDWLLDLDGFDYDKFDIEWLNEFGTRYYYAHFRKSTILKNKISSILKEDFDIKLKKIYCDIYN